MHLRPKKYSHWLNRLESAEFDQVYTHTDDKILIRDNVQVHNYFDLETGKKLEMSQQTRTMKGNRQEAWGDHQVFMITKGVAGSPKLEGSLHSATTSKLKT